MSLKILFKFVTQLAFNLLILKNSGSRSGIKLLFGNPVKIQIIHS